MITAFLILTMAGDYDAIRVRGDWQAIKCCVGDLDGDSRYDYVVMHPRVSVWPGYESPSADTYKIDAYRNDGTFLWRHDMGWAIEQGIIYAPMAVHDLDGDGKAEVVTKCGAGDPRDTGGKVTSGPEWLVVLDGMTGQEKARKPWPSRAGLDYNNYSRNKMTVAYLDGITPSVVVVRGTYIKIKAAAYQLHEGRLRIAWEWKSSGDYDYQGGHRVIAADLDGDGCDEIVYGPAAIDDDGTNLWSANLHHVNPLYVANLTGKRDGKLSVVVGRERPAQGDGIAAIDGLTGQVQWTLGVDTLKISGTGICADLLGDHDGLEVYGKDDLCDTWLLDRKGKVVASPKLDQGFFPVLWDGDEQHELLRGGGIWDYHEKWQTGNMVGQYKGDVVAIADIVGDWREEFITTLPGEIRIYSTAMTTAVQRPGLMLDRKYRTDVTTQGSGAAMYAPIGR